MIFLTFGTGLGAGLILNGALYTGKSNSAGEVGHIRLAPFGPVGYGKSGSFEGFCSGAGIAQLARIRILEQLQIGRPIPYTMQDAETMTAKKLAAAAHGKEPLALGIFREAGEYLGRGLAVLADILNPECIVIGGVFMARGAIYGKRDAGKPEKGSAERERRFKSRARGARRADRRLCRADHCKVQSRKNNIKGAKDLPSPFFYFRFANRSLNDSLMVG